MLEPIGWLFALGYSLEFDLHILNFFLYGILPQSVSILLVNIINLFGHLRQLGPKFMVCFKVLSTVPFYHGDDFVPFLQDMINAPVRC